eukprot:403377522
MEKDNQQRVILPSHIDFKEQKIRLEKLQEALNEAYPDLYTKKSYKIDVNSQRLLFKGYFRISSTYQLPLCKNVKAFVNWYLKSKNKEDLRQNKLAIYSTLNINHKTSKYMQEEFLYINIQTDLIKKLESENEFQQKLIQKLNQQIDLLKQVNTGRNDSSNIPGSRLNQRLTGHSQTSRNNQNPQALELNQIDREVHLLKIQYSNSKKSSSQERNASKLNISRDASLIKSQERPTALTRSQLSVTPKHNFVQKHSQNNKLEIMSKEQLISLVQDLQAKLQREISSDDNQRLSNQSFSFTNNRNQASSLNRLSHQSMQGQQNLAFQSNTSLHTNHRAQDQNTQLHELIQTLKVKNQAIGQKDIELNDKDKEIFDLKRQIQTISNQESQINEMRQEIKRLQQFEFQSTQTLNFDYGISIKKDQKLQTANKNIQCDDFIITKNADSKYLVDRYEKLKQQYDDLKDKESSQQYKSNQFNFGISDLINVVLEVKQAIMEVYLGKHQAIEPIRQYDSQNDLDHYTKILKSAVRTIYQSQQDKKYQMPKINENEEIQQIIQKVEIIAKQFNENIDGSKIDKQNIHVLSQQQKTFNDLLVNFYRLKNNFDFFDVKYSMQKQKLKTLKHNYSRLCQNSDQQQLIEVNQQQLNQIIKLKKQLSHLNKENQSSDLNAYNSINTKMQSPLKSEQATSPYRESISNNSNFKQIAAIQQSQNFATSLSYSKSPTQSQSIIDKKISYLNSKLKDSERQIEKVHEDLKEKSFLNSQLQEELNRKNQKIVSLESVVEDMNKKIGEQQKYIDILEHANKETEKQFLIETQKSLREHDNMMRSINFKENELKEYKLKSIQLDETSKETETLQRNIQVLKSQYEREKRLVDEKVRQLTELQTTSTNEKILIRENHELKTMNMELNRVIKEERALADEIKNKLMIQIQQMTQKVINIENGCAKDIVLKLKTLRNEITYKIDKSLNQINDQTLNETVDSILNDIMTKTNQQLKQRENLQKAVNVLQSEKQQLFQQLQQLQLQVTMPQQQQQRRGFMNQSNSVAVAGGIMRSQQDLNQFYHQPIQTISPKKQQNQRINTLQSVQFDSLSQQQNYYNQNPLILQSQGSVQNLGNYHQQMPQQQEENLVEYLQAEVTALRQKKDQLQSQNKQLQSQFKDMNDRICLLDIFQHRENVENYQSILQNVRDILHEHQQEQLLDDILSKPLKTKSHKDTYKNDTQASCNVNLQNPDDSSIMYNDNSLKLLKDLEVLLPLFSKCIYLVMNDKEKLEDQIREINRDFVEINNQRDFDRQALLNKEEQDKQYLKKIENDYKNELHFLRGEKDNIIQKSKDFGKNLQSLQQELQERKDQMKTFKKENKTLREELNSIEEKTKRVLLDKFEKDLAQQLQTAREESYYKGRKDCSDEMTTENTKLRTLIDSLRKDLSEKSKRAIELQFEVEEVNKIKRKSAIEVEELYVKLNREKEGQRDLQQKLDGLLQEVGYLKNLTRGIQ